MTAILGVWEQLHLMRPLWLSPIPVVLWLWWTIRARASAPSKTPSGIAVHLAEAMIVRPASARRLLPIDGVALALVLTFGAAAGPTWSRLASPLVAQTAPLVVALNVSKSMGAADVAPTRLERAKQKISDLLDRRSGAQTGLVAYAGSAHRVVPLTEDPAILRLMLEGLVDGVVPKAGDNATAALSRSLETLGAGEGQGAILFVTHAIDSADLPSIERHLAEDGVPIITLAMTNDLAPLDALNTIPRATVIELTPDGTDLAAIVRVLDATYRAALADDDRLKWEDRGWILAIPAAVVVLLWFRRGWTMRWAIVATFLTLSGGDARAGGWRDWFLTGDQQGWLAYRDKRFAEAGALFDDPLWRGFSLYRAGQYAEAVTVLSRLDGPEADFVLGLAHIRNRGYRPAIEAFEAVLERDPTFPGAARNAEIARAILAYVEKTREQSGTEEGSEGADDIVFDKEGEGGAETPMTSEMATELTEEQWLRTVETRSSDFLRQRFLIELNEGGL